ncbi:738_t:CDS:2, partial [Cetraspora pellucida]
YYDRMSHKIVSETPKERRKRLNHISSERACNTESSKQAEFRAREATRNRNEEQVSICKEAFNILTPSSLNPCISTPKAVVDIQVESLVLNFSVMILLQLLKARIYPWSSCRVAQHNLGSMDRRCKVLLPPLQELPSLLNMLLTRTDPSACLFKKNIRMYNSALAFTSMGAKIDQSITGTSGPYSFHIYDEMYHQHELQNRLNIMPKLDPLILINLQQLLYNINPYSQIFKQAKVAIIMVGNGQEIEPMNRDIILQLHDGGLQRIFELHRAYEPLHYVLMFPRDDDEHAILASKNDQVDTINSTIINQFSENPTEYLSTDTIKDHNETANLYPTEFLNSLSITGLPSHKLILKT